jgi:hypothetical protein
MKSKNHPSSIYKGAISASHACLVPSASFTSESSFNNPYRFDSCMHFSGKTFVHYEKLPHSEKGADGESLYMECMNIYQGFLSKKESPIAEKPLEKVEAAGS